MLGISYDNHPHLKHILKLDRMALKDYIAMNGRNQISHPLTVHIIITKVKQTWCRI